MQAIGENTVLAQRYTLTRKLAGRPDQEVWISTDATLDRVKVDKKRIGDKVRFIAIREVGMCDPVEIDGTELRRILRRLPPA